jgi:putative PEP-CTERM system histidine kinase
VVSEIAVVSYGAAAAGWLVLLLLLASSWRGRLRGGLLVAAVLISLAWAVRAAHYAGQEAVGIDWWFQVLEVARGVAWLIFLAHLLAPSTRDAEGGREWIGCWAAPVGAGVALLGIELSPLLGVAIGLPPEVAIMGHVGLAIAGLVLIEQLFRNTHPQQRWATKFLYLGLGVMFAYDFFLYADALLFKRLSPPFWAARGFVNVLAVPLLAVAAARNPVWSVEVFVSRRLVQYSTALVGAGIYLLAMAGAGYYIREFGGDWGTVLQITFLAGAGVLLVVLLFSGQARARVKVLLSKHFYQSKYDYREEWLRFTHTLSTGRPNEPPRARAIRALAEIVHGTGGVLWVRRGQEQFVPGASWNMSEPGAAREPAAGALARFLEQRQWVIDLEEYARDPELYAELTPPDWLVRLPGAWLVVPLLQGNELTGFLVLDEGNARRRLNWEDRDLLKTAGRQVAGYVALLEFSEALGQARQFEAFHRLSAYVVHDLKNIAAQLMLVVANASQHKTNPAFVEDAFLTVADAAGRMNRLLAQLRKEPQSGRVRSLALAEAARQAVAARAGQQPVPVLRVEPDADPWVRVDQERLVAVLEHLIQNAQEATGAAGAVEVRVHAEERTAVVAIRDDGCGMEAQFIRERLFQPFTTTKGNAGMGIGVYESDEFARGAGGELAVESAPGAGTTFYLRLPRLEPPAAAGAR